MDQLFVAGGQSIGASADGGPYLHELLVYKKSCHRMAAERTEFQRTSQCLRFVMLIVFGKYNFFFQSSNTQVIFLMHAIL